MGPEVCREDASSSWAVGDGRRAAGAGRWVGYGRRTLYSRHLHVLSGGLTRAPCVGPRNLCLGMATFRKTESQPGSH